ncbi:unnamed protein product, partial [Scytosiphon promiscuus]
WSQGGSYPQQRQSRGRGRRSPPRFDDYGEDSERPWDYDPWVAHNLRKYGPRPPRPRSQPQQQHRMQRPQQQMRPPAPHGPPSPAPRSARPPLPQSRVLPPRNASG